MKSPEAYEVPVAIDLSDIDRLGHVNNVSYLRWVQEAAVAHWTALAPPDDQAALVWVVLRHEIDYKQPAYFGDEIIARTWVGSASWVRFERFTEILRAKDRALFGKARTIWCALDAVTGKPTTVRPEVRALFSVSEDSHGPIPHVR